MFLHEIVEVSQFTTGRCSSKESEIKGLFETVKTKLLEMLVISSECNFNWKVDSLLFRRVKLSMKGYISEARTQTSELIL